MPMGPDEVRLLIERVQAVRDKADRDKSECAKLYTNVSVDRDARLTSFSKLINVLNSLQLGFTFTSKHLLQKSWWDLISKAPTPDGDKQVMANEFVNFLKVGFVQALVSSVESSLRILLRSLDVNACHGGMAQFKSIYECLFNSKLDPPPFQGTDTLDLLRLVRNTIHNNGVYFSPKGADETVTWRGSPYQFRQGVAIDFVTWELLIDIADDVRRILREVVEDPNVRKLTAQIVDPFSLR